ncbi:MAG: FapA family protein [bacterium]|nr:FapA family protein [bacterium]
MKRDYDVDGYFKIASVPTGVYLTVYPPLGDGKKVELEEILIQVKDNDRLKDVDYSAIKEAVQSNNGTAVKIGEYRVEPLTDLLLVEIADDELKAYLTILYPPEGGKIITLKDIHEELVRKKVVYGIEEDKLAQVLKKEEFNKSFIIAQGLLPQNGEDAKLTFKFKKEKEFNFEEVGGRVDFKDITPIDIIKEDEIIAFKTPLTHGIPGVTVTGKLIPAQPGKDIPFPKGKNIEVSPDGLELRATTSGRLTFQQDKINIEPIYKIDGNVDYATGNINFPGTVIIKGDVLGGFKVKADGDVFVGGCVENSSIESKGNITVTNGILGKNEGYLRAAGNISAKYIEHSRVESHRDVIVGESIIHSYINAKHKVIVNGRLGVILGGRIRAGLGIRAKMVGSWTEVPTELEVGIDPQSREEISQLANEIVRDKKKFQELKLGINTLLTLKAKDKFSPEKEELLATHFKAQDTLVEKLRDATSRITTLQKRLSVDSGGQITVLNVVHPGVKITIHNISIHTFEEYKYVTFTVKGGEIEIAPYKLEASTR